VEDFELAKRHGVYTINVITTVIVTNDAEGIKVKRLGGFQLNEKTACMQVF
jgi:hypothetical protein